MERGMEMDGVLQLSGLEEVMLELWNEGVKEELSDEDAAERERRFRQWCFPLGHLP